MPGAAKQWTFRLDVKLIAGEHTGAHAACAARYTVKTTQAQHAHLAHRLAIK